MTKEKFLFFTYSWNHVYSTALPSTDQREMNSTQEDVNLFEGLILTLFAIMVICFLVAQITIYVKFYTSKRNSWRLRKRAGSIAYPRYERRKTSRHGDSFTVTTVPCKPGLAYSARSMRNGDFVFISPVEDRVSAWNGSSFRMAPANYASVFMVDSRGHFGPRLEASPEAALQMYKAARRQNTLREKSSSNGEKCFCHKRTCSLPPSISPVGGKECENPGYDSDTASASFASPEVTLPTASLPNSATPTSFSERDDGDGDSESPVNTESETEVTTGSCVPVKPRSSVSDDDAGWKRKRGKGFLFSRHSSSTESCHNQNHRQAVSKCRKYIVQHGRPGTSCSSSDSDRNSPDSSAKCLKAARGANLTSGSESDFSLTSVSSLSVLSAVPIPRSFGLKNISNSRTSSFTSLRNSWLAKM